MGFCILGPLTVTHEDRDITPTAPKVRQVLALLLVRRNQIVQISEFVDELWGSRPPDSAMTTLQTYIYRLRKDVFDPTGLARLHTQPSGYFLEIKDDNVDVSRFERLSEQGRLSLEKGDTLQAVEQLSEALRLWRCEALVGVTKGEILSAQATRLEEDRLRALEMRVEAEMRLGRYRELISELKVLVRTYPLHERLHGELMTALDRAGRRYEALEVYRRLRELLVSELGIEPSPAIQRLHQSLLAGGSGDRVASRLPTQPMVPAPRRATTRPANSLTIPAQLPPDVPDFVGRATPLRRVCDVLAARRDRSTTFAHAVSICGMTGVGKTTLALHAAHMCREQFPDGQLFADLRSTSTPAAQADVLAGFLRALGVPEHQIPVSLEERSSLFRTWSNGRRILVVLDDASTGSQVAPLLPATPQSAVVITSRWDLRSLPGVQPVRLGVMSLAEGVELLSRLIGRNRVVAERDQAEKIANLCGLLPLALRCVGVRLAASPSWPLSKMASLIECGPSPLDQLRFAEFDIRADYDKTYLQLDPHDRSALRLLSLLPPSDFTAATAANLIGNGPDAVEAQLNRLVSHHLLDVKADDGGDTIRYELHKLTRLYARERLSREFMEPERS